MNEIQAYRLKCKQMARREWKQTLKTLFPLAEPVYDTWSINLKKANPIKRQNTFFSKDCKVDEFGNKLAHSGTYYSDGLFRGGSRPVKSKQSLARKVTSLTRKTKAQYVTNEIKVLIGAKALTKQDIGLAHARKHNRFV